MINNLTFFINMRLSKLKVGDIITTDQIEPMAPKFLLDNGYVKKIKAGFYKIIKKIPSMVSAPSANQTPLQILMNDLYSEVENSKNDGI